MMSESWIRRAFVMVVFVSSRGHVTMGAILYLKCRNNLTDDFLKKEGNFYLYCTVLLVCTLKMAFLKYFIKNLDTIPYRTSCSGRSRGEWVAERRLV